MRTVLNTVLSAIVLTTGVFAARVDAGIDSCIVCLAEQRVKTTLCCRARAAGEPAGGSATTNSPVGDRSACFTSQEKADCSLLNNESTPDCKQAPCDDGEEMFAIQTIYTVGRPVEISGSDPCDGCPTSEAGRCADGVDNDEWLDMSTDTDCMDPDCASDPACTGTMAPAASNGGIALVALAMLALGVATLRRRFRTAR